MLEQFKNSVKSILNDHFDNIPLQININFKNNKYKIFFDQENDDVLEFNIDKMCISKDNHLTDDLLFLCQKYIDQYNIDNGIIKEDGECVATDCGGVGDVSDGGGVETINGDSDTNNPEINSKTVGNGLYVTYVCPGALPYFKFKRKIKRKN